MKKTLSIISILFCLNSFGQAQFDAVYVANNSIDSILSGGVKIWEKPESLCPVGQVEIMGECYDTVHIGSQVWLVDNLYYDDSGGGVYSYNDEPDSSAIYGYLYTWDAAVRVAASIPGWHLPSDTEFSTLVSNLGGSTVAGGKLKETGLRYWQSPNTGADNSSGFTMLGAGIRGTAPSYALIFQRGTAWSSTEYTVTTSAYILECQYNSANSNQGISLKGIGRPIRLIQD